MTQKAGASSSSSDLVFIMSEDTQVNYDTRNGKLTYSAVAKTTAPSAFEGALETTLEYADGELTSTDPISGAISSQQSEKEAREFINSLLFPNEFNRDLLKDISFDGNEYTIRGTLSNALTFKQALASSGVVVRNADYHANVSVKDGRIIKAVIYFDITHTSGIIEYSYEITYN